MSSTLLDFPKEIDLITFLSLKSNTFFFLTLAEALFIFWQDSVPPLTNMAGNHGFISKL